MAKLIFLSSNQEKEVADGEPIKEALEEAGVPFGCQDGICGTCMLEIEEGMENLSEKNEKEMDLVGDDAKMRLGCQCRIKKGVVKIQGY